MENRKEPEIVFSRTVKAGKRIYYLDVKKARNEDLYVCITESKRTQGAPDQQPNFEKHKLFLYKEDFAHFTAGLEEVIGYIKSELGEIEERQFIAPDSVSHENTEAVSDSDSVSSAAPSPEATAESHHQAQSPERRRFSLFGRKNSWSVPLWGDYLQFSICLS